MAGRQQSAPEGTVSVWWACGGGVYFCETFLQVWQHRPLFFFFVRYCQAFAYLISTEDRFPRYLY